MRVKPSPLPRVKRGNPGNLELKRKLRTQMTKAEFRLWFKLRGQQFYKLKFRRQHGTGPDIVDFYCPEKSLVIEVDGDVHANVDQRMKDKKKEAYLTSQEVQLLRYMNEDVLKNLDGVLVDLSDRITCGSTSPYPSLQRRGL